MSERVVDTSVLIAILWRERFDLVDPALVIGAVMSSVNVEETLSKAAEYDLPEHEVEALLALLNRIEPYTEQHARIGASLRPITQARGLGLGDRSCLALAIALGAEVYTAEQIWAGLDVGCPIQLVRSPAKRTARAR